MTISAEDETDEPLHTQPLGADLHLWRWAGGRYSRDSSNLSCGSTRNRLDRLGSAARARQMGGRGFVGDAWFLLGLDAGGWEEQAPIDNSSIKRQLNL